MLQAFRGRPQAILALLLAALLAVGCAARRPAPVTERTPPPKTVMPSKPPPAAKPVPVLPDAQPGVHVVRKGDTLYSIALDYGLDYRELADWNNIDPAKIRIGQQLRLAPPAGAVTTAPLKSAAATVEARPLGSTPSAATLSENVKTEPMAVRAPYSDQAYAQLAAIKPDAAAPAKPEVRPQPKPDAVRDDDLDWMWPASGKMVSGFNDGANLKGIAIAGKHGQPVLASAAGRVIFSGVGIRGLGKLIVIKHNNTFLSVYAHNSELLVKEGQNVAKGQKIAEMGNTDTDQVKLHFEIRRFGKPVDPLKLLPDRSA